MKPIVFVIMPFGKKEHPIKHFEFDFDRLYTDIFEYLEGDPELNLNFIREDFSTSRGIIHKTMIEKILLSEYAIADLSFSNANAYYELGIRHCAKEETTIILFSDESLKFDVAPIKAIKYSIDKEEYLSDSEINTLRYQIKQKLLNAKVNKEIDSPIYDLLPQASIAIKLKDEDTKSFKQRALELNNKINTVKRLVRECTRFNRTDTINSLLALTKTTELTDSTFILWQEIIRALIDIEAYEETLDLINTNFEHLDCSLYIRQQLGFILNRLGKPFEAIDILEKCLNDFGEISETYGLLGRVYKDFYKQTPEKESEKKVGFLNKSIETYLQGFNLDSSNFFTGINVANLLFIKNTEESLYKMQEVLTIINFTLSNIENSIKDYWVLATKLNAKILMQDFYEAYEKVLPALVSMDTPAWKLKTTKASIDNIIKTYNEKGVQNDYLLNIQKVLSQRISELDVITN